MILFPKVAKRIAALEQKDKMSEDNDSYIEGWLRLLSIGSVIALTVIVTTMVAKRGCWKKNPGRANNDVSMV